MEPGSTLSAPWMHSLLHTCKKLNSVLTDNIEDAIEVNLPRWFQPWGYCRCYALGTQVGLFEVNLPRWFQPWGYCRCYALGTQVGLFEVNLPRWFQPWGYCRCYALGTQVGLFVALNNNLGLFITSGTRCKLDDVLVCTAEEVDIFNLPFDQARCNVRY